MNQYTYKIRKQYTTHVGYPAWAWLICALIFFPSVILLTIAHYFTEKVEMVEVEYKKKGAWLSKRKTMTMEKFQQWKEGV